jgi:hypothetical protein
VPAPAPATCAEATQEAMRVPLDVFFLLDGSASMAIGVNSTSLPFGPGIPVTPGAPPPPAAGGAGKSKLDLVRGALDTFLKDPMSAGLGAGLSFFPGMPPCQTDSDCPRPPGFDGPLCIARTCSSPVGDCAGRSYQMALFDFAELPAGATGISAVLAARRPAGSTPLGEALVGTLAMLRSRTMAHPDRRVVLVIASDGVPDDRCGGTAAILEGLRKARAQTPPLSTYAIGVFGKLNIAAGRTLMNQIATAGGTGAPYVLDANMTLGDAFLKALNDIRGSALPCEFAIPAANGSTPIDFDKVNVSVQSPTGASQSIGYAGSLTRCDPQKGGWYYDVDPSAGKPTRVVVCPATCAELSASAGGKVALSFGCKTRVIE